eukprot:c20084_g1_i1 orf=72-524(+)
MEAWIRFSRRRFHGPSATFLAQGLKASQSSFFSARLRLIGDPAVAQPFVQRCFPPLTFLSVERSELGYAVAIARRQVFTEGGWARNWTLSKEKLKQTLVLQPKAAIAKSMRDAAITEKTRTILSNAKKPLEAIQNTASHYKDAVGLQVEA